MAFSQKSLFRKRSLSLPTLFDLPLGVSGLVTRVGLKLPLVLGRLLLIDMNIRTALPVLRTRLDAEVSGFWVFQLELEHFSFEINY